ncbi:glycoside hydrolase family 18 protein [Moesziomyces antarcticus]|uniref:Glycoside hydrolase family 18 protein n=2 Tax=Pseudozyma antarctica TaxID=84753 RepID=A0A081CCB6_PSEA2|nr:glycoside hydrolase family 18 protein [Moesziomyces antarcticus]GAK64312.1 glycoside hydrolase family 18 protein [Moesziomyces antarcticus]SPO45186.1 related to Chitinase A precursor [Moesziomyces antarcticus]
MRIGTTAPVVAVAAAAAAIANLPAASGMPHQQSLYNGYNGLAGPAAEFYDDSIPARVSHGVWSTLTSMFGQSHNPAQIIKTAPGVKMLDSGFPTADTDSIAAPRFVLYGDQDVAAQSYGAPPYWNITGFNVFNLAFWTVKFGVADNAAKFAAKSDADKKWFKSRYAGAGMKLMVSVFGATDTPQSMGRNATKLGKTIAAFVKQNGLDGVDVDYEEMDLFAQGKSANWLIELTRSLRAELPSPDYIITHAPVAPWFNKQMYPEGYAKIHAQVGNLIDWYNVQFYNQQNYDTCDELIWNSGDNFPLTSVFEINKYAGVPLDKIVVGKPAVAGDADNGFMRPSVLGGCLNVGVQNGWKAGAMFWEYPHMTPARLNVITSAAGLS